MKFLGIEIEPIIDHDSRTRFSGEIPHDRNRRAQITEVQKVVAEIACKRGVDVAQAPTRRYHFFEDRGIFNAAVRRLSGQSNTDTWSGVTARGHALIFESSDISDGADQSYSTLAHEAVHMAASWSLRESGRTHTSRSRALVELGAEELTHDVMDRLGGVDYHSSYAELLVIGNHFLPRLANRTEQLDAIRSGLDCDILASRNSTIELMERTMDAKVVKLWEEHDPVESTHAENITFAQALDLPEAAKSLEDPMWAWSTIGPLMLQNRVHC